VRQVSYSYGGLYTKDYLAYQVIDGGKQELSCILLLFSALIPQIESIGSQHSFQCSAHHHRDRTLFYKSLEVYRTLMTAQSCTYICVQIIS
jgi:hypothetical protein